MIEDRSRLCVTHNILASGCLKPLWRCTRAIGWVWYYQWRRWDWRWVEQIGRKRGTVKIKHIRDIKEKYRTNWCLESTDWLIVDWFSPNVVTDCSWWTGHCWLIWGRWIYLFGQDFKFMKEYSCLFGANFMSIWRCTTYPTTPPLEGGYIQIMTLIIWHSVRFQMNANGAMIAIVVYCTGCSLGGFYLLIFSSWHHLLTGNAHWYWSIFDSHSLVIRVYGFLNLGDVWCWM